MLTCIIAISGLYGRDVATMQPASCLFGSVKGGWSLADVALVRSCVGSSGGICCKHASDLRNLNNSVPQGASTYPKLPPTCWQLKSVLSSAGRCIAA